jgi:hypothetical protein
MSGFATDSDSFMPKIFSGLVHGDHAHVADLVIRAQTSPHRLPESVAGVGGGPAVVLDLADQRGGDPLDSSGVATRQAVVEWWRVLAQVVETTAHGSALSVLEPTADAADVGQALVGVRAEQQASERGGAAAGTRWFRRSRPPECATTES